MKKHLMPEMKEGGVNVTPLIDIVMCLIIFFMLVAKIGVSRGDLNLRNESVTVRSDSDIRIQGPLAAASVTGPGPIR